MTLEGSAFSVQLTNAEIRSIAEAMHERYLNLRDRYREITTPRSGDRVSVQRHASCTQFEGFTWRSDWSKLDGRRLLRRKTNEQRKGFTRVAG